jgi:hypothetical protein|uniref:DUF551 domain-containing protein n=1 Tax=Siphoviridae sp. ctVif31 TaxID=2825532 RepID=A0A8S5Q4D2_9CAUD|nr:MAG TPA: Protein of unknown function (DUF551) [Siphoviridae sp. ctVif31]
MRRVQIRLEQYKAEIEKKSQYKHELPGSALDIVNTLLNDLEQDEKENGWIPVKYHQISEKERKEESISRDIICLHFKRYYMLDGKMPDDGQEILATNGKSTWQDTSFIDCDGYYLDSNYDWIEITAWRPLPEPYKED